MYVVFLICKKACDSTVDMSNKKISWWT